MKSIPETVVLGTGFAGLTSATRLAEKGHPVRCHGDQAVGASLENFGQLHSGAVYAPVLPDVAAACWQHRSRWFGLLGPDVPARPGVALFSSPDEVEWYTNAWAELGMPVEPLTRSELDEYTDQPSLKVANAFALPDLSVDVGTLHSKTVAHAAARGVTFEPPASCALFFAGTEVLLWCPDAGYYRPRTLVLAAGHRTVHLLNLHGIQHPLNLENLPYGVLTGTLPQLPFAYWLDDDRLAISPQRGGIKAALPGRPSSPTQATRERDRLTAAISRRWPEIAAEQLQLKWGHAAEPSGPKPDPSAVVVDLSDPPPGWGRVDNLVICLPGKWTTAWHAADQVADAVAARG